MIKVSYDILLILLKQGAFIKAIFYNSFKIPKKHKINAGIFQTNCSLIKYPYKKFEICWII